MFLSLSVITLFCVRDVLKTENYLFFCCCYQILLFYRLFCWFCLSVCLNISRFVCDFAVLAENISEYTSCDRSEFACLDELNLCVPRSVLCDHTSDCENGKDEDDSICKCTSNQVSFNKIALAMQTILRPLDKHDHFKSVHKRMLSFEVFVVILISFQLFFFV